MSFPYSSSSSQQGSLPPINLLFAEVQEREIEQSSSPPVRRPSAWPGFPGPDKNALTNSGHQNREPPPPLQVGRPRSAPFSHNRSPTSPSTFPGAHLRDHRSASDSARRYDDSNMRSHPRPKRESWSDSAEARAAEMGSGRLPPISMTPTGSPHLYPRYPSRPRQRDPACQACAADQQVDERRAATLARGPIPAESPYAHKQQIPTPLPPQLGHTLVTFQPTPSAYPGPGREFGVSMADILAFRPCLKDPDSPVLDNGVDDILLTLEAKGYTTFVQPIAGNCVHRRLSRFNLAYAVASAFDAFFKSFPFNPAGLKAAAIVVRSVEELRLVNLYSRDGRTWRVHVAYVV
ncbi:hypothetical protein FB45DRAFT_888672 [Roridomyces roridus]|uniref:Uncharacterized protein n=1 Tax=Roridomyces roridus TaxID=1738132 RepID=A0AAD7CMG7_9AGAR|nr:hypothetical protein FB45DRAFT_888672 [Roridomyces roridus]